jgi:type I restriction enzyme S subunit
MSEFHELRVGDHITLLSGFPFNSEYFDQEEGTRLIRIRDLLNPDGETYFRGPFDPKWVVKSQDILIGMDGDFNIVRWKGSEALLNQRILKAEAKSNGLIDEGYFFYWCAPLLQQIHNQTAATTVKHLSVKDIEKAKGRFPDKSSQSLIAEILSTLDEAIEQTEALIAKMQQVKSGMMHDLFTRGVTPDGRLRPTREQAPELYKESPLGWIPKEWAAEKLGNILRRCGGYLQTGPFGSQLHAYEYQIEGIPVVMPQDINDGLIGTEQIARIHDRRADELARHRMRFGDIVIARRGDLSRAALIGETEQGWVCGTGCFLLRLGQSALRADFAAYVYRQDFVQRQIAGRAVGTTMPSLNNSVMAGLYFPFCDEDEQLRIVERLGGVEQSIRAFSQGLTVAWQLKHGLMHDLLTGRVQASSTASDRSVRSD